MLSPSNLCKPLKRARPLLGTLVEISVEGASEAPSQAAIDAAFAVIADVHARMSAHEATSDLAALHAAPLGTWVRVSAHTVTVVQAAVALAEASNGAFNPCLGARMARWGYVPKYSGATSEDFRSLLAEKGQLCRTAPVRLDLGGIAKGYAVDCAVAALQAAGIPQGTVNAGGDLRCFGPAPVVVGLRDTVVPQQIAQRLSLQNSAMATSAPYFSARQMRGKTVSALYDPAGKRARTGSFSVTVVAATAMHADALTKVALNAPAALAAQLLTQHHATAHWLGRPDDAP